MKNQESEKSMMVPQPTSTGLMVPPKAMTAEEMLKVSGGADEEPTPGNDVPKPPEMKVVELKDGGFVKVPEVAIFKTEEEAKEFVMPEPFKEKKHHHPHMHHGHHEHHKHHFPKP